MRASARPQRSFAKQRLNRVALLNRNRGQQNNAYCGRPLSHYWKFLCNCVGWYGRSKKGNPAHFHCDEGLVVAKIQMRSTLAAHNVTSGEGEIEPPGIPPLDPAISDLKSFKPPN